MTPEQIDQVFGRGRLKMVTGEHVEVFREAIAPGERRRYTKRFLATSDGDFGPWTEREWRILARLIGHGIRCVPDVVQFDGGAMGGARLVQTYDAGVTVDQWATLLPVARDDAVRRHVFEDCAHWWALAYHCLCALEEIHALGLVHLDIKADNICVPYDPADFDPDAPGMRLYPVFTRLALIDFAFSLVSRESLSTALPIGWQKDYDYQSPRLLRALEVGRQGDLEPTRELDWRCDIYSLAAMLKRYLPTAERANAEDGDSGWTPQLYDDARTLIFRLRDSHDRELPDWRPHRQLMDFAVARLEDSGLVASLERGWTLARIPAAAGVATPMTPITPMTRIARSVRIAAPPRAASPIAMPTAVTVVGNPERAEAAPRIDWGAEPLAIEAARRTAPRRKPRTARVLITAIVVLAAAMVPSLIGDGGGALDAVATLRSMFGEAAPKSAGASRASSVSPPVVAAAPAAVASPEPGRVTATTPDDEEHTATPPPAETPADVPDTSPTAESDDPAGLDATPAETHAAKAATPRPKVRGKSSATSERTPEKSRPAEMKREPAARRSPAASTIVGKSPVAPSSTLAGASGRSNARMIASPRAPAPAPTPTPQVAMATPSEPSAPRNAPAPTTAPEGGFGGTNSLDPSSSATAVAPASAPSAATPAPEPKPATTANDDRGAPAEAGIGATAEPRPPAQAATTKPQRSAPRTPPRDDWRTQIASFFGLARKPGVPPAPIEERGVASSVARHGGSVTAREPARAAPAPDASAPAVVERVAPAPPSRPVPLAPMVALAQPNPIPGAAVGAPPLRGSSPLPVRPADDSADALAVHGRRMLVETVPRVAAQAQPEVSRVLRAASLAGHPAQAQSVVDAAYGPWASDSGVIPAGSASPTHARRLHDDARLAGASGRDVSEAINLGLRAFGANPRDPDIATYLAMLHLRKRPAQPEIARQLALHAIAVSGSRRSTRSEDWGTLAVASAMTGRETDAVRAYLVELALTSDVDRSCKAALNAYASFGDRLRVPVSAMLSRARSQARGYEYPSCAWPSSWTTTVARSPAAF